MYVFNKVSPCMPIDLESQSNDNDAIYLTCTDDGKVDSLLACYLNQCAGKPKKYSKRKTIITSNKGSQRWVVYKDILWNIVDRTLQRYCQRRWRYHSLTAQVVVLRTVRHRCIGQDLRRMASTITPGLVKDNKCERWSGPRVDVSEIGACLRWLHEISLP